MSLLLVNLTDQSRSELLPPRLIIGRTSDCQICIPLPEISKQHCLLELQSGQWQVTDLGSSNGTLLNGKQLEPQKPQYLHPGDLLTLHTYAFRVEESLQAENLNLPSDTTRYMPQEQKEKNPGTVINRNLKVRSGETICIGRSKENDISISSPLVSRHHANITVENNQALLHDLQSTNGVFVNGQRITGKHNLSPGDIIQIADARICFSGINEALTHLDERNNICFEAIKISKVTAEGKSLLKDISFTVNPGEFVTILGGSGAGKSTTLDALNGFRPAGSGKILVNGEDYYKNFASYQSVLGYVPQSDIIHDQLNVSEALDYAAKLRLSGDLTLQERQEQVNKVIQQLGLSQQKDVPIRNLSGGQKKRVSIGVELLSEPSLFFLDEPTSGLDPGTEREMMRMMRSLADQGKTVFLITHAVGNLDYCHLILFLAMGGRVAYYGPPDEMVDYFHSLAPQVKNIPDIYNLMATSEGADLCVEAFLKSKYYLKYVWERHRSEDDSRPSSQSVKSKPKTSFIRQFVTFTKRYTTILLKDKKSLLMQLLQTPLIAVLIMCAFHLKIFQSSNYELKVMAPLLLFILACVSIWFGTSNAAQEIVKEMDIYRRERMVNLRILPYVLSKACVQSLISLLQCLVLVVMVCPAFGVETGHWPGIFMTLFLAAFTGTWLGLAISAFSTSREMAVVLVPLVLIPQIMFSGAITKVQDMSLLGEAVSVVTANRWSYQALGNITKMNDYIKTHPETPAAKEDEPYNRSFDTPKTVSWSINLLMSLALFALTLFLLKLKDIR